MYYVRNYLAVFELMIDTSQAFDRVFHILLLLLLVRLVTQIIQFAE